MPGHPDAFQQDDLRAWERSYTEMAVYTVDLKVTGIYFHTISTHECYTCPSVAENRGRL